MGKQKGLRGEQRGRHCKHCQGTGKIHVAAVYIMFGPNLPAHTRNCDRCQGRGRL